MSLKVVVFNGPPRCGKGIATKHLANLVNQPESFLTGHIREFKDELFKIAANTLGLSVAEFKKGYDQTLVEFYGEDSIELKYAVMDIDGDENSWVKDHPWYDVEGKVYSKREWLIHISENVVKPAFGEEAFGNAMVSSLPEEGIVFVSDSGFASELQPVIDHVGAENVLVVRIQRDGCSFDNDSRDYLTPEMFNSKVEFFQVVNNVTEEKFLVEVENVVGVWLNTSQHCS